MTRNCGWLANQSLCVYDDRCGRSGSPTGLGSLAEGAGGGPGGPGGCGHHLDHLHGADRHGVDNHTFANVSDLRVGLDESVPGGCDDFRSAASAASAASEPFYSGLPTIMAASVALNVMLIVLFVVRRRNQGNGDRAFGVSKSFDDSVKSVDNPLYDGGNSDDEGTFGELGLDGPMQGSHDTHGDFGQPEMTIETPIYDGEASDPEGDGDGYFDVDAAVEEEEGF